MNRNPVELIREAINALRLKDIILFESHLFRDQPLPNGELNGVQQHKRGVRYGIGEETNDSGKELQIMISLGTRVVLPSDGEDAETENVFFGIEADFLVAYELEGELDEKAISAFSESNAVHNVWPFWRQHVFDTLAKARLPHLEIPLFSGNGP